jgi:hypothetical protein
MMFTGFVDLRFLRVSRLVRILKSFPATSEMGGVIHNIISRSIGALFIPHHHAAVARPELIHVCKAFDLHHSSYQLLHRGLSWVKRVKGRKLLREHDVVGDVSQVVRYESYNTVQVLAV